MSRMELLLITCLEKRRRLMFAGIVTLLAIWIRFAGRDFVSGNMAGFLLPWFDEIKQQGGLLSLRNQVGNYNIPYQFLMAVLTYFPFAPIYMIKIVSVIFDFVLAAAAAMFVCEVRGKPSDLLFLAVYSAVLFLPTVILNSAYWGQCDSIYTAFGMLALLYLFRKQFPQAFVCLGAALAFKLQAVFLFPFFVYYYILEKRFSIFYFAIILGVDYLFCIPGFFFGRSFLEPIQIYAAQTDVYHSMYLNFPSFWGIVGNSYETMKSFGILFMIFVLGCGLMLALEKCVLLEGKSFVAGSVWTLWTVLLFLPAMHERYSYMLDILLIVLGACDRRFLKIAVVAMISSIMTYGNYLFGNGFDCRVISVFYIVAYVNASVLFYREFWK